MRDLTRRRTQLVRERAGVVNRIQKILEDANIKLAGVASDILGVSGRSMLTAISRGTDDPVALAEMARKGLRRKIPALKEALDGLTNDHHRFLLRKALEQVEALEGLIEDLSDRVEEVMAPEPLASARRRLMTIPGISATAAEVIVAEIGADMSQFPDARATSAPGPGSAPARTRAARSAGRRRPPRGASGCGPYWSRWPGRPVAPRGRDSSGSTPGSRNAIGRKKALIAVAHRILATGPYPARSRAGLRGAQSRLNDGPAWEANGPPAR